MTNFLIPLIYGLNEFFKFRYKRGNFSKAPFSRYITKKEDIGNNNVLRWQVFKQNKKTRDMSVYDVTGFRYSVIKAHGERYVVNKKIPKLYGHAILFGRDFESEKLAVSYNNVPPRHANIKNWLPPVEENVSALMAVAKRLNSLADFKQY